MNDKTSTYKQQVAIEPLPERRDTAAERWLLEETAPVSGIVVINEQQRTITVPHFRRLNMAAIRQAAHVAAAR